MTALLIHDLKFSYTNATPWVVDVRSLELASGEQMLLTAGSGKGKSTLLQLIAGLLDPVQGTVKIGGEAIHARRGAARDLFRGRRIGMIFQTFNLLQGFSAHENVEAAMMLAEVAGDRETASGGLLHRLGIERGGALVETLSVGQQQRVAVARALSAGPRLVLADEPTASLDPENAASAMDLIQSACRERGAALLCVSHDPAMPARFARRATLEELAR